MLKSIRTGCVGVAFHAEMLRDVGVDLGMMRASTRDRSSRGCRSGAEV
jgi:hypothetical protein